MRTDFADMTWQEYEDIVYEIFCAKHPELLFERNVHITGKITGRMRQIDIASRAPVAGYDLLVVIDCKKRSKKADVNDVEGFLGLLDDVDANLGVLVTDKGWTKTAGERAKHGRVRLDIIGPQHIREYAMFDYCEYCGSGDEHSNFIQWGGSVEMDWDFYKVKEVGRCNWCNMLYVKCMDCGSITGIPDLMYNQPVECQGECGTVFTVQTEYAGQGMLEYTLVVDSGSD